MGYVIVVAESGNVAVLYRRGCVNAGNGAVRILFEMTARRRSERSHGDKVHAPK